MRLHEDSVMIRRRSDLVWAVCTDDRMIRDQLEQADAEMDRTGPTNLNVRFGLRKAEQQALASGKAPSPGLAHVQFYPEDRLEITLQHWEGEAFLRQALIAFTLTPVEEHTRLTMTIDGEPAMGLLGKAMVKTTMKRYEAQSHARLEQLAADIEKSILETDKPQIM